MELGALTPPTRAGAELELCASWEGASGRAANPLVEATYSVLCRGVARIASKHMPKTRFLDGGPEPSSEAQTATPPTRLRAANAAAAAAGATRREALQSTVPFALGPECTKLLAFGSSLEPVLRGQSRMGNSSEAFERCLEPLHCPKGLCKSLEVFRTKWWQALATCWEAMEKTLPSKCVDTLEES